MTLSGALKASVRIFDSLLNSIPHARFLFFDKIPFDQITSLFFTDVEAPHSISAFHTFLLCGLDRGTVNPWERWYSTYIYYNV